MIYFEDDSWIFLVYFICIVSSIAWKQITWEIVFSFVITNLVRLYSIIIFLNKRTDSDISSASSSTSSLYITKVSSWKYILSELINKTIFVEDSRNIKFLNLVSPFRVPYKYKVIYIIRTKITIVIKVSRNIFEVYNKVCWQNAVKLLDLDLTEKDFML